MLHKACLYCVVAAQIILIWLYSAQVTAQNAKIQLLQEHAAINETILNTTVRYQNVEAITAIVRDEIAKHLQKSAEDKDGE